MAECNRAGNIRKLFSHLEQVQAQADDYAEKQAARAKVDAQIANMHTMLDETKVHMDNIAVIIARMEKGTIKENSNAMDDMLELNFSLLETWEARQGN